MILEKGIHSMKTPRNSVELLNFILKEAGYTPEGIKIKLGPKIECSSNTPVFKIGQITPRGSVEIKLKADGNGSRHLFYMFPPSGQTAEEVHNRLAEAISKHNKNVVKGEPGMTHTSEILDNNREAILKEIWGKTVNHQIKSGDLDKILRGFGSSLHRVGSGLCNRGILSRDRIGVYNVLLEPKDFINEESTETVSTAPVEAEPVEAEPVEEREVVAKMNYFRQRLAGAEQHLEYMQRVLQVDKDIEELQRMLEGAKKQKEELFSMSLTTQPDYDFIINLSN